MCKQALPLKKGFPVSLITDTEKEPVEDAGINSIIFYALASIPCIFTTIGLVYMCKTNCRIKCPCCAEDLEKKDDNQTYGEYSDHDVMQVLYN